MLSFARLPPTTDTGLLAGWDGSAGGVLFWLLLAFVVAAKLATYRPARGREAVVWIVLAALVLLTPLRIAAVLFLLPIVAVGRILPPPPRLATTGTAVEFITDFLSVVGLFVLSAAVVPVMTAPHRLVLLALVIILGSSLRSFVDPAATRTTRIRVLWPVVLAWLLLPAASLNLLLLGTLGVRLAAYAYPREAGPRPPLVGEAAS